MKKLSDEKFRNLYEGFLFYLFDDNSKPINYPECLDNGCLDFNSPHFEEAVKFLAVHGLGMSREDELRCMISLLKEEILHEQFFLMFDYKIYFSASFVKMIVQAVVTLQLEEEFLVRLAKNKYFFDQDAIQLVVLAFLQEVISEETMKLVLQAASDINSETWDIMFQSKIDILVKAALKMRFPGFDYRKYLK